MIWENNGELDIISESEIDYIRRNSSKINLSDLAGRIKVDPSNLRKAVLGLPDRHGRVMTIPRRCMTELRNYIDELRRR